MQISLKVLFLLIFLPVSYTPAQSENFTAHRLRLARYEPTEVENPFFSIHGRNNGSSIYLDVHPGNFLYITIMGPYDTQTNSIPLQLDNGTMTVESLDHNNKLGFFATQESIFNYVHTQNARGAHVTLIDNDLVFGYYLELKFFETTIFTERRFDKSSGLLLLLDEWETNEGSPENDYSIRFDRGSTGEFQLPVSSFIFAVLPVLALYRRKFGNHIGQIS